MASSEASDPVEDAAVKFLSGDRSELARRWVLLAASALAASGLLSLGVVAARIPALARHLTDTELARRVLVVHVDLGVVVWFAAIPVALFHLAAAGGPRQAGLAAALAPWLSGAGAAALASGLVPGWGHPYTVNYVPLVDQPLFVGGLLLFAAGVVASYLDRELLPGRGAERPADVAATAPLERTLRAHRAFLRVGAGCTLLALVVLAAAWLRIDRSSTVAATYEPLFWGTGHVLQLASVAFVVVAWALLAAVATGRELRPGAGARLSLALLGVAALAAAALAFLDPGDWRSRAGYAWLMRWGLFPALLASLAFAVLPHLRAGRSARAIAAARVPLVASVVLMLAGLVYGALIRGSDLRVPGHYHATIGAVTLAYMALTLLLLPRRLDAAGEARRDRALGRVAVLYGTGQLLFSTGLMIAGACGLGRKTYGVEQLVSGTGQRAGLACMALGGALALAAGLTWAVSLLSLTRAGGRSSAAHRDGATLRGPAADEDRCA